MGEIIRFDFKKGKRIETKGKKPKNESAGQTKKEKGSSNEIDELKELLTLRMREDIKRLTRLPVSPTSLQLSRETAKNYTTEELIGWLEKTSESDWVKK